MEVLEQAEALSEKIAGGQICIVQFGAETCAPCGAIRQKLEDWLALHSAAKGIYIPLERFPQLAAAEGIFTVPTLLVYAEGKLSLRESGYFSLEELLQKTERLLCLME